MENNNSKQTVEIAKVVFGGIVLLGCGYLLGCAVTKYNYQPKLNSHARLNDYLSCLCDSSISIKKPVPICLSDAHNNHLSGFVTANNAKDVTSVKNAIHEITSM